MMKFGFFLKPQDPPSASNEVTMWEENLEMAKVGEELGFTSCYTPEHHGTYDGYNPSPFVTLSAVAAVTNKIRVGTGVHLLPLYHSLHVAEDTAMLDVLSHGRLDLGVGISNVEREFRAFGLNIKHQASLFDEGIEVLLRAWTEEKFSFYGRHYRISEWNIRPKPVQKPHPPLLVGAISEPGVRRAGRFGLPWLAADVNEMATLKKWAQTYEEICHARGKRPEIVLMRDMWVVQDKKNLDEVEKLWWPCVADDRWYYFSYFPGRGWGGGAHHVESWLANVKKKEDFTFERSRPLLVCGTPDEVIEDIEKYRKELKVENMLFRIRFGAGPPLKKTIECLQTFSKTVIPYYEHEIKS